MIDCLLLEQRNGSSIGHNREQWGCYCTIVDCVRTSAEREGADDCNVGVKKRIRNPPKEETIGTTDHVEVLDRGDSKDFLIIIFVHHASWHIVFHD